ncbi:MAG: PKD domain-containing protein [Bacteroidetes bacterium]|nr:PKD domain-containing protein [Bacteroidota bacterium]
MGEFAVVATQANTTVEFTPTINGGNGKIAGQTYQITLANAGDCYQFQGDAALDISGTVVKSISTTTNSCKPIAVFAGTTWSAFDCNNASGGDNLYQELFPVRSWGKKFITAPFIYRTEDIFRIYVRDPATVINVTENGSTQNLTSSNYDATHKFYFFKTGNPIYIDANQPISVVQFMTSMNCKSGCTTSSNNKSCHADPEMVVLNPIEQTLKDITFFSAHQNSFTGFSGITNVENHYVNIIIDKNHKSTVKIDGAAPKGTFIDIPATSYSYLQEDVTTSSATNPVHNVIADTGFSAIVYGTGRVESYGYNGGTNVLDLYQYIRLQNPNATASYPATCVGTDFKFSITLPYQPLKLNWDFGNSTALTPNTNVNNNNPVFDSSFVKDGKTLYVYKLSGFYKYTQPGTYSIKVLVNNPTSDGCGGDQEISYDVKVFKAPRADFNITTTGCTNTPTTSFLDNSTIDGGTINKYLWDFGDGTKDSIKNPTKTYNAGGTYSVKYSIITDIGCLADTIKTVTFNLLPISKFYVDTNYCANSIITILDSSYVPSSGIISKWYWDYGDGRKDTLTSNNNLTISFAALGKKTIILTTENTNGCKGNTYTRDIWIRPNPTVGFSLPDICLDDAIANFIDSSKISDGTNLNYSWNFGDKNASVTNPNTSTLQSPTHSYSDTGYYSVKLVVSSLYQCKDSSTKSFTVNGSTTKANFTVLNNASLCSNDSVRIQNTSTVDFGNITKIEVYWDTANNLLHKTIDNSPQKNKIYSTIYNNFQQPFIKIVYAKMYAYSGVSCVSEKTVAITLHQSPKVQFLPVKSICKDAASRIINEASEIGGVSGTTTFTGIGITNTSSGLFNPVLVTGDSSSIKYTFTSNGFACIDSARQTIKIIKSPIAKFGLSSPLCEKNNISFIDSSSTTDGTIISWKWNFSNNDSIEKFNSNSFSYIYSASNTFKAVLKVTTDSGCKALIIKTIKINPLPKVNFIMPKVVCLPIGKAAFKDTTTIADNSQPFTYLWSFGDKNNSTTSTLANPTHYYSLLDSPFVKLIVTSNNGCVDSTEKQLTRILPQPKAAFSIKPDTSICIYDTMYFTDKSNGKTSAIEKWFWNFGGLDMSNQQNPFYQFNDSGTYKVALHISNVQGCISDTAYANVIINPYPILDLPTQLTFLQGGLLTIKPTYYFGQNLSYYWQTVPSSINKYMLDDTVLLAQVFPNDDLSYKLTLTSNDMCSVSDIVKVLVLKAPVIPNAFSPNGDNINDKWEITHLESYPGSIVTVFDRYGKIVYQSKVGYSKPWDGTYNGTSLAIGTYYYIINTKTARGILSGTITILK